jgi:hypothetical protein
MTLTTTYTLDKPYYYECFDESLPYSSQAKPKYPLLALLITLGLLAFYQLENHYLGSFMIMLAVVECLSFYYKRPWWVARQMMSRASGSEVTIVFDDVGVKAENPYKHYQLTWQQITDIIETERGYILKASRGMQYLSKKALNEEIVAELNKRATQ